LNIKTYLNKCDIIDCKDDYVVKNLCRKHYNQKYHAEHREYEKERKAIWYNLNKEGIKKRQRIYRKRVKDTLIKNYLERTKKHRSETQKRWRANNQEKIKGYREKYRKIDIELRNL
jgi:hypothetical protein